MRPYHDAAMAIIGAHALLYTPEPERLRELLRDVLETHHVDAGEGWLIFRLPPAELGVHPSDGDTHHQLSFMCDEIEETMAELRAKGVAFRGEPKDAGYGIVVTMVLPGGVEADLYEPRHKTAI